MMQQRGWYTMADADVASKIEANREALEELSNTDLPVADIATALLELEGES